MRVVIVYESLFGTTREAAEAIAEGVREGQPDAEVSCLRVTEAGHDVVGDADLLVVGGPTHMRGMTSSLSRKMGLTGEAKGAESAHPFHPEPGAEGPGVRDWLSGLSRVQSGRFAAAFDTRVGARLAGGAADGIGRKLRHHGYQVVRGPMGFLVDQTEGPLLPGEWERAKAWGAGLVREPVA